MANESVDNSAVLCFTLSSDAQGMELHLQRMADADVRDLRPIDVLKVMAERKFYVDEAIRQKVTDAVTAWREDSASPRKVLLNTGRAPVPGEAGYLVWEPDCDPERHAPDENDNNFSHYEGHVITVKANQLIAKIIPPTQGTDGYDIYGVKIPVKPRRPYRPKLKGGCSIDEDSGELRAKIDGTLKVDGDAISVCDTLNIDGSVDFNTGHVDAPGDITIAGHVADMFNVTAGRTVSIGKDVYSAEIHAGGDVSIAGSLTNHRKGICLAGGNAFLRLVDNSIAVVRGDINIAKQAANSDLFAGRKIKADSANIPSGVIAARGGLVVHTLGSPSGTHMLVLAGVDWVLHAIADPIIARAEEIEQELEKRMPALNSLRMNIKRLTAQQREQTTELECEAQLLGDERDEGLARVESLKAIGKADSEAKVTVLSQLFPGVELRLGNRLTKITKPVRGPITFSVEQTDNGISIVSRAASGIAIAQKTGRMENPLYGVHLPPDYALEAMEAADK